MYNIRRIENDRFRLERVNDDRVRMTSAEGNKEQIISIAQGQGLEDVDLGFEILEMQNDTIISFGVNGQFICTFSEKVQNSNMVH